MPSDETLKEFYAAEIERLTDSLDNLQDEINAIFAMADGQPGESAAQAVKRQLGRYSQRSRDEDTVRIRLNHARIEAEDTVRSLREMLDSQGRISEQHRARVHTLAERVTALERVARASYGIIHEGLHVRDQCPRFAPKGSCKCRCHVDMPPPEEGRDRQTLLWIADDLRRVAESHLKSMDINPKRIERKHLKQIADVLLERARNYERRAQQGAADGA